MWPMRFSKVGKGYIDPLPRQGGWLYKIRMALDHAPNAPQRFNAKKEWVDLSFEILILTAEIHAHVLREKTLFEMFAQVKDEVSWAQGLSVNCVTNLFMALLTARGAWKADPSRPTLEGNLCRTAIALDRFQERMKLIGELIDIQIFLKNPDATTIALDNGGVQGFIERGLLYPEHQIVMAEVSEGLHRLTLSSAPGQDEDELANTLQGVTISHPEQHEDVDMEANDADSRGFY